MDKDKRATLEAAGWRVGSVQDFLDLDDAEMAIIELKIALGGSVRTLRHDRDMSQRELAELLATSQPRVARLEQGDASLDRLLKALLVLGLSTREIAEVVAGAA